MIWQDLAPLLETAAPTLGKLLGGALPIPFGEQIGSGIGQAIAAAVGATSDPQVVAQTLQGTDPAVLKMQLQTLEANAQAMWQSFGVQAQATSATTQAELLSGAWYQRWWRPAAMYLWIATWPVQLWMIAKSGDAGAMVNAFALWNAGPAALAGVYSYNRTQEKLAAAS